MEAESRPPEDCVETQFVTLDLPTDGFRLVCGETLPAITVAYEVYGERNADGSNVVFVCHALTGDAHAAMHHADDDKPGWWDPLIGPGKGIDTTRFQVVCANILGGCKGTTGPASINPRTSKPYGIDFPEITLKDVVRVHKLLLDALGVPELFAVVGGSLGGMQALEWAVSFPVYVKRCICIAASVNLTAQALSFDIIGRREIEDDPNWHGGTYLNHGAIPRDGLSRARQIGHVTYLSPQSMTEKFGRETRSEPIRHSKFSTNFQVESYLDYQGGKFVDRFDANSYLYITRMMDLYDLKHEHGDLETAFSQTQAQFLVVSISSDWLFPPYQQLEIVQALIACRRNVSYFQLKSPYGHDAFLIEYDMLAAGVSAFLTGQAPATPPAVDRLDLDLIADSIDEGSRVLDVGSGDGALLCELQQRKSITGVCLDKDYDMVFSCMQKGLPALQLDADAALEMFADDSFDTVLINQTIQQLHSAVGALTQILRISRQGVVGFPNFAYYEHRMGLFFFGRLPITGSLPHEWYDSPNIHLVTVSDFVATCEQHGFRIGALHCVSETAVGRTLIGLGLRNLGSERVLASIVRS